MQAAAYLTLAGLLVERGGKDDVTEALKAAARAQAAAEPFPELACEASAVRARAFLTAGNVAAARALIASAMESVDASGSTADRREMVRLVAIETLMELGRDDELDEELRGAHRDLDARLSAIGNPKDRESVRTRVPECRRILDLYAERFATPCDTLTETAPRRRPS